MSRKTPANAYLSEEFAKPSDRLLARSRIVRAREAERLLHSAPFFGPASPAAAAFASPVHDQVRNPSRLSVSERDAVPERRVLDRTAGTAEFPKDFWRFSKADNQKIEIDRLLHATHGF